MMGIRKQYIIVYSTKNLQEFFSAKNILSENGIDFKDTTISNQLRINQNPARGNSMLLSRGGAANETYSLSVKKADEERARQILNERIKRK